MSIHHFYLFFFFNSLLGLSEKVCVIFCYTERQFFVTACIRHVVRKWFETLLLTLSVTGNTWKYFFRNFSLSILEWTRPIITDSEPIKSDESIHQPHFPPSGSPLFNLICISSLRGPSADKRNSFSLRS